MTPTFAQIDAFSSKAFAGNPAAVLVLPGPADEEWMAAVARETNLPATAFVHAIANGFAVRWFTATTELQLCGHGTLASAHFLYETGRAKPGETIRFESPNGALSATTDGAWIELDFPAIPEQPIETLPGLADALGTDILYTGRGRLDCIVEVGSEAIVRDLHPDVARLRDVKARGVIVTSRATTPGCDFVSRFFAPSTGINEDFVTGSAHCCLAPFWAKRLGKSSMMARQLSARGGVVKVTVDGDRVRLGGQAVTVVRGDLAAPPRA